MMGRLKESRWVFILLSIVLAIVFWFYVRASVDPPGTATFHNVRVEVTGTNVLTSQGLTVASLSTERVEVRVEAPTSVLTNLRRFQDNMFVRLDVSRCVEGENRMEWRVTLPTNFNVDEVVIQEQSPAAILVTVEKLYSQSFPVEFRLNGQVSGDYQMGTPAIEPEQVVVSGPVEQVNQVAKVAAILEDSELDERFAGDLPLTLLDQNGNPLTDLEITLSTDTAYVVVPVVVTKKVPLTVSIEPGGGATKEDAVWDIEPKTIVVSGSKADLEGLEEIALGTINLSEVLGTNTFTLPITLDPSFTNESGLTEAEVKVTVEGLDTEVFAVSNIRTSPPPEGWTVDVVTQSVLVTVRGPAEELAKIDASQIIVMADLSDVTTLGGSRVPARVYLNGTSTVGVIGEYTVAVDISR